MYNLNRACIMYFPTIPFFIHSTVKLFLFTAVWCGVIYCPHAELEMSSAEELFPVVNSHRSSPAAHCCSPTWCQPLLYVFVYVLIVSRGRDSHSGSRLSALSCCVRPDLTHPTHTHIQTQTHISRSYLCYISELSAPKGSLVPHFSSLVRLQADSC